MRLTWSLLLLCLVVSLVSKTLFQIKFFKKVKRKMGILYFECKHQFDCCIGTQIAWSFCVRSHHHEKEIIVGFFIVDAQTKYTFVWLCVMCVANEKYKQFVRHVLDVTQQFIWCHIRSVKFHFYIYQKVFDVDKVSLCLISYISLIHEWKICQKQNPTRIS